MQYEIVEIRVQVGFSNWHPIRINSNCNSDWTHSVNAAIKNWTLDCTHVHFMTVIYTADKSKRGRGERPYVELVKQSSAACE